MCEVKILLKEFQTWDKSVSTCQLINCRNKPRSLSNPLFLFKSQLKSTKITTFLPIFFIGIDSRRELLDWKFSNFSKELSSKGNRTPTKKKLSEIFFSTSRIKMSLYKTSYDLILTLFLTTQYLSPKGRPLITLDELAELNSEWNKIECWLLNWLKRKASSSLSIGSVMKHLKVYKKFGKLISMKISSTWGLKIINK